MRARLAILLLCFVPAALYAQTGQSSQPAQSGYFPSGSFDDSNTDVFMADWYSHELRVLGEPPLSRESSGASPGSSSDGVVESYRFLWLRTFDPPIVVRMDVKADGTGMVTAKVADGQAGFPDTSNRVVENRSRALTREQTAAFLALINRTNFWSIATNIDPGDAMDVQTDGSEWVLEGAKGGKYHVVARWSPDVNRMHGCKAIFDIGMSLAVDLAQLQIPKDKMY
jgi:hypothetical protein